MYVCMYIHTRTCVYARVWYVNRHLYWCICLCVRMHTCMGMSVFCDRLICCAPQRVFRCCDPLACFIDRFCFVCVCLCYVSESLFVSFSQSVPRYDWSVQVLCVAALGHVNRITYRRLVGATPEISCRTILRHLGFEQVNELMEFRVELILHEITI